MDRPAFIQWYPTFRCNQECVFCSNRRLPRLRRQRTMPEEDAFALVDVLLRNTVMELDILGGEPLLVPYLEDLITHAAQGGISIYVSTNGSLPDVVTRLARTQHRSLTIGFSLHGSERTHNALTRSANFANAIESIKKVIGEGVPPVVKSVLTRANAGEIRTLIRYLSEIGVRQYFILHEDIMRKADLPGSLPFPDFTKHYSALRSEFEGRVDIRFVAASGFFRGRARQGRRCDAGTTKLAVLPDGSCFPCSLLIGCSEFLLGNIVRDSFGSLRDHPVLSPFKRSSPNPCGFTPCGHYETCTGGCPAQSYLLCGDINVADPRCARKDREKNRSRDKRTRKKFLC